MNALDVFVLGRRLMRLGEEAMRGPRAPALPAAVRLLVADVFEHPDSSIGEIAARTGLRQSRVSAAVARLRDRGVLATSVDPADGRRTLVRIGAKIPRRVARLGAVSIDAALGEAMGVEDEETIASTIVTLESLLARLREAQSRSGPARRASRPRRPDRAAIRG